MAVLRKNACMNCPLTDGMAEPRQKYPDIAVCTHCVCDTTIPGIRFDSGGACQFCRMHDALEAEYPGGAEGKACLEALTDKIKHDGKGRKHDCIVGVSGGRDSSYLLWLAVECGLKPLAVHFDNGWNSETAASNIKSVTESLNVELCTVVSEWEEFKSLQLAFLKASVPDADIPTDVAIFGALHNVAAKEGVRYILNGHSFRTEGLVPKTWTYMDGRYINSIYRIFGGGARLRHTPNFRAIDLLRHTVAHGVKVVPLINYVDYSKREADSLLTSRLGWKGYGGHHHECIYTRFIQSCYLPAKFGIDKRRIELAAQVRSGLAKREDALKELSSEYPCDPELVEYVLKKLSLTAEGYRGMLSSPPKSFLDYPSYYKWMKALSMPVRIACRTGILPELLWQKYLS